MLLQRLEAYADRLKLPPRLYSETPVRYIVSLDGEGRLLPPAPVDTADPSSKSTKRGVRRPAPSVQRAVGIKPLLLADKADYTFGFAGEGAKPDRVRQCHEAYMALLGRCAATTSEPAVIAIRDFLQGNALSQLELGDGFDAGAVITFTVDGVFVIDLPSVQAFWADENNPAKHDAPIMQCVICGMQRPALERLEMKIKGVPGGQTTGTSVISFNSDAFESYGLQASLNAPTCSSCGERFTKSANELLSSDLNCIRLNNVAYMFWAREAAADIVWAGAMNSADPKLVRQLLDAARRARDGATSDDLDYSPFYATAFSGSGGRCVVRDWIETTIGEAKRHLGVWFRMQALVDWNGETGMPLTLRQLAYATIRSGDRNNPPEANVSRALLDTALTGAPLPHDVLYQAVRRCRAEQSVSRSRAALIKMVLLSRHMIAGDGEEEYMELEETDRDPAYLCGRLLAVIEQTQRKAMPRVNATIVDRFYGTASSAPASVFGRLMRGAQPHLSKLERDEHGAWVALQRRMEEVMGELGTFPRTLSLQEQGRFALGYYHERARGFAGKGVRAATEPENIDDAAAEAALTAEEE